ncbi:MAG: proline--tRNA ligase, partial [Methanomethylophilus sp.]
MTDKKTDFGEWYNETVEKAQLCDKRYPIKGMNVWTPYGWKLMTQIDAYIRREMVATGHDEVCFPLLIPQTEFNKEKEHIKGFDSEVYWVTKAGNNDLDIPLLLRPTSETAMYPMFSLWIRSHTDLPLKVFQIVNTFRYETKQTRAFMRVREIHFFESHTCHETEEDAQKQVEQDMVIMDNVAKELCLPYSMLVRTEWDKFPGAYYTVGIDTVMPSGRTLQLGSIHHYRTNFSKPYNITYEDDKGEHHYVHQTTYGMSERLLGAVVGVHADDKGLILPPAIAPVQVVIVPIFSKNNRDEIMAACKVVNAALQDTGFRSKVDDRDLRPGNKFFDWEMRGVPLRLELGGRDLESQVVTFARRDTGEKGTLDTNSLAPGVKLLLDTVAQNMLVKATQYQQEFVKEITTTEGMDSVPDGVILKFGWCGDPKCGHAFEDK